jgi:hypothetical protein
MSGKRRITVGEAEWNTLQRQARQLRELQRSLPKLVTDLRRQTQSDLAQVSDRLNTRQLAVERTMSELSDHTRALEAETNRRLADHVVRMRDELADAAGKLREETDAALAEQQRTWRAELTEERDRQRAEIDRLRSEIRDQAQSAADSAQAWLHDAVLLRDLIRDELPHERYARGEVAALSRRIATAEENVRQGQSQSALALAQQTYHDLSDLRLDIEMRDREWLGLHAIAYEAVIRFDGLAEHSATEIINEGEVGNEAAVDLNVDHWSEGRLSELRSAAATLRAQVDDTTTPATIEQLREIVSCQVPELEQQLADVVVQARMRLFSSQLRINVADIVVQALDETAGYQLEDHAYDLMDQRRTFFAKLQHPNGNEIVVTVAPSTDEGGQCVLRVLSYDYDTAAQADFDERADAITRELHARGIDADDHGCERGEPEDFFRDFTMIRQSGIARAELQAGL